MGDADYASSADEKRSAILAWMREFEAQLEHHPRDAELKYCMALLWYNWPERTDETRGYVYAYLKKALEENPEHVRAQVHLGFQQFDDAKYADALATFQLADVDSLGAPSSA